MVSFLLLCNGCHVIGHYPLGDDVLWYDLPSIVPNIDTYDDFEKQMDYMLHHELDLLKVKAFMKNHYTTNRAKRLVHILKKYYHL